MAASNDINLRFVVPLPVSWVVDERALSYVGPLVLGDGTSGSLHLPGRANPPLNGERVLDAPVGFSRVTLDRGGGWGSSTKQLAKPDEWQWQIHGVGVEIDVRTDVEVPPDLGEHSISGDAVAALSEEVHQWIGRFGRWTRLLLGQLLDPAHPSPRMLNPPASKLFVWASVSGQESSINSAPHPIQITLEDESAASERSMDLGAIEHISSLANDPAIGTPVALELLALGRQAAARDLLRQSIVDLGSAAEALLTEKLKVSPSAKLTLGALILRARSRGVPLDSDAEATLLVPRNAAIHSGVVPDRTAVLRAIEIVDHLVGTVLPQWSRLDGHTAHRPQRLDLTIFRG